ncbi:MAG: Gfo/Idh/MocA family oxidoreductase, partial [Alphaproteobacteria bacterium]
MSTVWLIGAGRMAIAYAKVLKALGRDVQAIGRSEAGAAAFTAETGAPCRAGGLPADLAEIGGPAQGAIVAVNVDQLAATSRRLIDGGVRRLLIEKPAGVDPAEIEELAAAAAARGVEAYVAYNRRFYASVDATRQAIEEDGGVTSVT